MNHPKNKVLIDGKLAYQWKKQQTAMSFVKNWRVAVDVGAHCGLWSMHLVKKFAVVHAFEPVALHRECWIRNVENNGDHHLRACALGEKDGSCTIHTTETSSGDSFVAGAGDIPIKRLDDFQLHDVDFIKLDCEGYELLALRGGEETLKRCRPTVCVEQKPNRAQKYGLEERAAVAYLQGLGAVLRKELSGDFFLSWD
jgi:FkbM family methyltransferase